MNATTTANQRTRSWQARWFHFTLWVVILAAFIIFLRAVEPILLPFVLGMLVAYLMDPLAGHLQRLGLSRSLATAIITFGLFALIVTLVVWLTPILYQQGTKLVARAPELLHSLEISMHDQTAPVLKSLNKLTGGDEAGAIPSDISQIMQRALESGGQLAGKIFSSGAALINVAALLLITPIVCFYMIRDWPSVVRKIDGLLPLAYAPMIREQLYLINRTLAAYLRGQLVVMLLMSAYYIAGLTITGLNFSLALGLLAGCIIVVPYIGSIISVALGLLIAHGQFDMSTDFWQVVAVYGFGQILESQILTPKIIGDRVGLHPLWMLFGMLAGAVLLGMAGVLLAVPLTAVIGVLVKFAVNRYLASGLYQS
jgi:predicted PurR-regulated permease PerM